MSTARIEKMFQKIQNVSAQLDEIYAEKRSVIDQLTNCHAKVNELKETKNAFVAQLNSINYQLNKQYERKKVFKEWGYNQKSYESQKVAEKNIIAIEENIASIKIKKASYEDSIEQIQSEIDNIFQKIIELNIQKKNLVEKIRVLRKKKDEYKRTIDGLKGRKIKK